CPPVLSRRLWLRTPSPRPAGVGETRTDAGTGGCQTGGFGANRAGRHSGHRGRGQYRPDIAAPVAAGGRLGTMAIFDLTDLWRQTSLSIQAGREFVRIRSDSFGFVRPGSDSFALVRIRSPSFARPPPPNR